MVRFLAVALVALILSAPVTADAGVSVARQAAKALRLAKAADKRSKRALAAVAPGVRGPSGQDGRDGPTGRPGVDGPKGEPGTTGNAGQDGDDGAQGAAGPQGPAGVAGSSTGVTVTTATNPSTVRLGAEFTTREETVVAVTVERATAARVLATMEGEIVETRNYPTPVACVLRVDGSDEAVREFNLAASERALVSLSAAPWLTAGAHDVRVLCRRSDGRTDAIPEFPAQRARLTVVG